MNPRYTDIPQLPEVYTLVQTNSSSWFGGSGDTIVQTNSGNWNQAYNTATVYQTNSATYAPKVELRSHDIYSSGDYAVQQGRNVELSFSASAVGTNVTITLPRRDSNDNAQDGDELLIRLTSISNNSTVTIRQYTYTGSLPYLGTFTNLITFPAGTPSQTIRLRLGGAIWSLLTTPNLFSPPPIGNITPNTGTFTTLSAAGIVHASGGNSNLWNTAYNTATVFQANSASYATRSFVDGKFLPLSGGTITGNLSVLGDIAYIDTNIQVTSAMFIDTNSTETALRVTQRGSGDVIRVEDSANPDSTPFIVKSDGLVGIGTDSPNSALTVVGNVSAVGVSRFVKSNPVTDFSNIVEISRGSTFVIGFRDDGVVTANIFAVTQAGNSIMDSSGVGIQSTARFGFSDGTFAGTTDADLRRDAADTLAQRRGTNPQTFRLYNTFTTGTPISSEFAFLRWSGNTFQIGTSATGSGSIRQIEFLRDGQRGAFIDSGFFFNADFGFLTPGQIQLGAAQALYWNGRAVFKSPAVDQITLFNSTETGFNRLNFGGTTAAFPALKNSLSGIQVRLADDTNFAPLSASTITAVSGIGVVGDISATGIIYTNSDIEITNFTKGIIHRSPNGNRWRTTITDSGTLSSVQL